MFWWVTLWLSKIVNAHPIHVLVHLEQGNQRWQTSPAAPPGGLGHCQTGMCMSNFMIIGWEMAEILHIEISWKHVSVTYDLDLWPKIMKIFVSHRVPILMCMLSFMMIGWEMTEILHFDILRKHGQTHKHTNTQTDMGITIPRPPPMGGEVIIHAHSYKEEKHVCLIIDMNIPGWSTCVLP